MKYFKIKFIFLIVAIFQISCKKYLEVDPPKNSLVQETLFQSNDQAISAITGLYATMASNSNFASGSNASVTSYAGVSSDELIGYNATNAEFYENEISPENTGLANLYSGLYRSIYTSNLILEGLNAPNGVTPPVKLTLEGEALFVRAFAYFYLVNLFGSVPLQLNTDYRITQSAPKATIAHIYDQIISDLRTSENQLPEDYPTSGRVRPNKSAVQALLARTYLYLQDWTNAEKYASLIIAKTSTYSLVNLDAVFLANSQEAIWQLMPPTNSNSRDGELFILNSTPTNVSLSNSFVKNVFEANDRRQVSWVKNFTNSTGTYYYPYKYKIRSSTTVTEYSMVLRLAEQYLIRAEARINQEKIDNGILDINLIRNRARPVPTISIPNPLPPLPLTLNKSDALIAVEKERRAELFSEWGHRWLDLKRTGKANDILSPLKSQWQQTDLYYPIPSNELLRNPNVIQNDGY